MFALFWSLAEAALLVFFLPILISLGLSLAVIVHNERTPNPKLRLDPVTSVYLGQ